MYKPRRHHPFRILIAIALATIAFTLWGFVWYATVFDDLWQSLITQGEDELIRLAEQRGFVQSIGKYTVSLFQAIGLYILIRLTGVKHLFGYLAIACVCSVLMAAPVLGNAVVFAGQSTALWGLDIGHFILGYAGMALTFWICLEVDQKHDHNSPAFCLAI